MKNICYRFVNKDMTSRQDEETIWKIGKWNKQDGKLICCKNGFHASLNPLYSLNNIFGNKWFIAEYRGKIVKKDDKFCASEMRLIKEIPIMVLKRFALFCAKDCLKYYEREHPNDKRVSECVRINELYLDGKATIEELRMAENIAWSVAESAAGSAAGNAAESAAAWSARSAAWSIESAESIAWSAESAVNIAWNAESAAWSATGNVARKCQEKELLRLIEEYK